MVFEEKTMKMRELKNKDKCPCDSGELYGSCCKKKALKWLVDDKGFIHQEIPLNDEAMALINEAKDHFLKVFERKPKGNDPIFLAICIIWLKLILHPNLHHRHTIQPRLEYKHHIPT